MIEDRTALPNLLEGPKTFDISQNILGHIQSLQVDESKRIAVFDLDNTLLIGDIGDAVFAKLVLAGEVDKEHWKTYQELLSTDRHQAYLKAVTAMADLPLKTLVRTTLWVLNDVSQEINVDGIGVMIPRPHPAMQGFVRYLNWMNYRIYIISASNQLSAQIAGSQWFGIPEENIYGVRSRVVVDAMTAELLSPVPIGEGKVEVFRKFVGDSQPLIVAGDSPMDIPLMQLVSPSGLCIWVGESGVISEIARGKLGRPHGFYLVQRPSTLASEFQEERAYL